ncbi:MAG: hypothetical protein ACRDFS_13475, partial [Chloroflexota bacterium]
MNKLRIAILIAVVAMMQLVIPGSVSAQGAVSANPSTVAPGGATTISASGLTPSGNYDVVLGNGQKVSDQQAGAAGSSTPGSFAVNVTINPSTTPNSYSIDVFTAGNDSWTSVAHGTFTVSGNVSGNGTVTVTPNPAHAGDTLVISGSTSDPQTTVDITVDVKEAGVTHTQSAYATTDASGSFSNAHLLLPSDTDPGTYT